MKKEIEIDMDDELREEFNRGVARGKEFMAELTLKNNIVKTTKNKNNSITIKYEYKIGAGGETITFSEDICNEIIKEYKKGFTQIIIEDVPHQYQSRLLEKLK